MLCYGTYSGRDVDKTGLAGLSVEHVDGCRRFKEAKLILECRKIYRDCLKKECFIDKSIFEQYSEEDFHIFYVGEIESFRKQRLILNLY